MYIFYSNGGGSRISGKGGGGGVHMYKGVGVRFAHLILLFSNISLRPNYFNFIGYLKTGRGGGSS